MTSIDEEIKYIFADKKRDISTFKSPRLVELAERLNVEPKLFRQWFNQFRAETGAHEWYRLREAVFIAYMDWLKWTNKVND